MSGTFFTRIIPNALLRQQSCAKQLSCRFVNSFSWPAQQVFAMDGKNKKTGFKPVNLVQMERLELSRLVGTNT